MSKLPAKQIYLLIIIIVGIIALSIYSTYAIFTLESQTSDIVNIHTPNTLQISENISEYKQIALAKNSYVTTDIDIYNSLDTDMCYSIWYKVVNKNITADQVKVYQVTKDDITSSTTIGSMKSTRVTILATNDTEETVKINIGLSSAINSGTCSLNIKDDKKIIDSSLNEYQQLATNLVNQNKLPTEHDQGYLTYKNITDELNIPKEQTIYISEKFNYKDELFTLENPIEVVNEDINKYLSNKDKTYYTCLDKDKCNTLYKINNYKYANDTYNIDNYDKLIGYLKGTSGLKKQGKDYIFYGDNPNNFIYYNCKNQFDTKTCELYRIIGVYYDQESSSYITKIIKNDPLKALTYNSDFKYNWEDSNIKEYLDKEYKLYRKEYLTDITYKQEYIKDNKFNTFDNKIKTNISILSLSDFISSSMCNNLTIEKISSECINNNWLNISSSIGEWTQTANYEELPIAKDETEQTDENIELTQETEIINKLVNNKVFTINNNISTSDVTDTKIFRPVVFLKNRIITVSGDGTLDNPYIIR